MTRNQISPYKAMTIIELLVVILIISILTALVLTGIQQSRKSAYRTLCSNNLHQIGIALNQYISRENHLPPGAAAPAWSPHVALLSDLEQSAVLNSVNFQKHHISAENNTLSLLRLNTFLCPVDNNPNAGFTNYLGNRGFTTEKMQELGPFKNGIAVSISSVIDGMSNTICFSESLTGYRGFERMDDVRKIYKLSKSFTGADYPLQLRIACSHIDRNSSNVHLTPKNYMWYWGDYGHALYNHTLPPNQPTCQNGGNWQTGAWTASSLHGNGIYSLFIDGHIQWVSATIDNDPWFALGTISGSDY